MIFIFLRIIVGGGEVLLYLADQQYTFYSIVFIISSQNYQLRSLYQHFYIWDTQVTG